MLMIYFQVVIMCILVIIFNQNLIKQIILTQINSRFVGTAKYSTEWQKFFKAYIKSLPVDKAKEVIKKELTAFAVNMNPDDAEQTKWLTTLRLLNTTYSEL